MNTIIIATIVLSSMITGDPALTPENEAPFVFLRKEKGIQLSSRELRLPDKRTTRELKAEFVVDADAATILRVLTNEKYATSWMKGVIEFSIINRENENVWFVYLQYGLPWPFNNQDCIFRYNCIEVNDGKGYALILSGIPDYIPVKHGVERISHLSGRWIITGAYPSGCRVEYSVYSEQKPKYPRWATDPIILKNMINTMVSMKKLSEQIK